MTLIVATTPARADRIWIENPLGPGHFVWPDPQAGAERWLDVTLPPWEQPGQATSPSSVAQVYFSDGSSLLQGSWPGFELEVDSDGLLTPARYNSVDNCYVPSGADGWDQDAYIYHPGLGSNFDDFGGFFGVRFDLGAGFHYGAVFVERQGASLDVLAWSYETEPGVFWPSEPIPEPGTLAMLALGAAVAAAGRRRGGDFPTNYLNFAQGADQ